MKTYYTFYCILALFFAGCSKKDTPLVSTITGQLSSADSLSTFNSFLKAAGLTDAEISSGITVIAPSNRAFGGVSSGSAQMLPDSSVLRDYIVKGILKESDFVPDRVFTTLSGKQLRVSVVADPIYLLNGVIININSAAAGDNYIVYAATQLLNAPTPLFFTIWDATKWSSSKPKGDPAAQANVYLFHSREDFASSVPPAYAAVADNEGVAIVNGVLPGKYYVVASKGAISNVFKLYEEKQDGVYVGYWPDTVLDNAGNFIWKDLNRDGRVDKFDVGMQPSLSVEAFKNTTSNTEILLGSYYKLTQTGEEAQAKLNAVYSGLSFIYGSLVVIDGMLSDDASCTPSGIGNTFCPFDNYTVQASDAGVAGIWNSAYSQLSSLNGIMQDLPAMNIDAGWKADLMGQAKGLRAYINLLLLTYFGDIPLHYNRGILYPEITRVPRDEVYNAIISDLTAAIEGLPVTRTDSPLYLTKDAAHGLYAKAALLKRDYPAVLAHTSQVISGARFSLTGNDKSWLTSSSTPETIWAPPFSRMGASYTWFFDGAFGAITVQECPVLRYAHILLIDAEAEIGAGNWDEAVKDINFLRARNGLSVYTSFASAAEAYNALYGIWQTETYRQGDRFANLQRWGTAATVLAAYGYDFANSVLPIPQVYIEIYPMQQNPGY